MKHYLSFLVLALCLVSLPFTALAQHPQLSVSPNVHLSSKYPVYAHVNPMLAVSPDAPNRLAVATLVFPLQGGNPSLVVYASEDGGGSWTETLWAKPETLTMDPWLLYGPEGMLELFAQSQAAEGKNHRIVYYTSKDHGQNWSAPQYISQDEGGGFDNPAAAVGPERRYLTATEYKGSQGFTDLYGIGILGGNSQELPVSTLSHMPAPFNFATGNPVVSNGGLLIVPYFETGYDTPNEFRAFESQRLWVGISNDNGNSFGNTWLVSEGQNKALGSRPHLAIDNSQGNYANTLYLVRHVLHAQKRHMEVWTSRNGFEWNPAPKLEDITGGLKGESHPQAAVNHKGQLGLAYFGYNGDDACNQLFFSLSVDGAYRFGPRVAVSPKPICPNQAGNEFPVGTGSNIDRRFPTGGDYYGLAADAAGNFHLVWADARSGKFQLYYTKVTVGQ